MAEPASAARDTVPGTGSADLLEAVMPDTTPRPPRAERRRAGLEARAACPLESLGAFEARGGRAEAVALVAGQSADRVPSLVPLRYERMRVSPFTFLRGSAVIMADDLSRMPATGLRVQCVGDAHIANFGIFASPTRRLVFDVNDFDETAPGPWEWDVMRLVASVEACGRDRGFSKSERHHAVKRAARAYRRGMERFAGMGELEVWYDHLDLEDLVAKIEGELPGGQSRTLRRAMRKASAKDSARAADRLAERVDGRLRFRCAPPELVPLSGVEGFGDPGELADRLRKLFRTYFESLPADRRFLLGRYRFEDAAQKVVGVGSVGTRAWVALFTGADEDDPLVMQAKEAGPSVLERHLGRAPFASHGERVVQGQRLIQSTSDILLGWTRVALPGGGWRDYYVRQLWNGKGSIDLGDVGPEGLASTARLCARALAHAHARTGDAVAISAYLGDDDAFEDAMWDFARAYADQNEEDYRVFIGELDAGRLT